MRRLRPHHLLCLLTYVGKGYSPAFTDNLDQVAQRLAGGEALELVPGPDDICAALLRCGDGAHPIDAALPSPPHCLAPSVSRRDEQALRSLNAHLPEPLHIGSRLVLDAALLQRLRGLFARGEIRQGCVGCEWHGLCTAVAASGYVGVRLPCVASPPASA